MQRAIFLAPLVLAVLPMAAMAENGERYRLERTETGFVRMDTQNGQISYCDERSGQLVCKDAADERTAYVDQIDDLSARVAALESRIAELESGAPAAAQKSLPTEEEFEQTMGFMERFLRRFMGIVKDLDKDAKPEQPPAPDRT